MANKNSRLSSSSLKTTTAKTNKRARVNDPQSSSSSKEGVAPLVANYNERIRPLLDAVDKLRHLNVMNEGIELPTIVVVGDQSVGKSSVLESLAGISLPRGQGICTRVPLIMRLQSHFGSDQILQLEYHGKVVLTDELNISDDISAATEEIAGGGKCISNTPLTLVVKKKGIPDLTMVDLPGITRVPVHGQPEDIYEQVSRIIMEYISPKESIILNVLSATVDFPTCESIRMSNKVDKTGERTLAVVTKVDRAPEGLLEKVTADDVNIGLGYVCVRNRIGNETYEEARVEEALLFQSHPLLSKIDKSIVGIPVLAQQLVHIQANSITKCLPDIVKKISDKLNQNMSDLEKMPKSLTSIADAMTAFMRVLSSSKESLRNILVKGEYCDYPDEDNMHCRARFAEMLNECLEELQSKSSEKIKNGDKFLMNEIKVLMETNGIGLPNFLSQTAFVTILQKKVNQVAEAPVEFMEKVWNYVEEVVVRVIMEKSESYPQLQSLTRRATENLMFKMKTRSLERVKEIVKMEKFGDYSCNPEYMQTWSRLMLQQVRFMEIMNDTSKPKLWLEIVGEVDVGHLRGNNFIVQQAFDLKMRLLSYWKIVLCRLTDNLALHLSISMKDLVTDEMETEIANELMGAHGGIERMLEESFCVANKREKLNKSIKLLKDSKIVLANIMDRVTAHAG